MRRYIEYVQRRNAEWSLVGALFGEVRTLVMGTLGLLSHLGTCFLMFSAKRYACALFRDVVLAFVFGGAAGAFQSALNPFSAQADKECER